MSPDGRLPSNSCIGRAPHKWRTYLRSVILRSRIVGCIARWRRLREQPGKITGPTQSVVLRQVFPEAVDPEASIASLDFQQQLHRSQLVIEVEGRRCVRIAN